MPRRPGRVAQAMCRRLPHGGPVGDGIARRRLRRRADGPPRRIPEVGPLARGRHARWRGQLGLRRRGHAGQHHLRPLLPRPQPWRAGEFLPDSGARQPHRTAAARGPAGRVPGRIRRLVASRRPAVQLPRHRHVEAAVQRRRGNVADDPNRRLCLRRHLGPLHGGGGLRGTAEPRLHRRRHLPECERRLPAFGRAGRRRGARLPRRWRAAPVGPAVAGTARGRACHRPGRLGRPAIGAVRRRPRDCLAAPPPGLAHAERRRHRRRAVSLRPAATGRAPRRSVAQAPQCVVAQAPQCAVAVTCTWRHAPCQSGRLSRIGPHNCFCYCSEPRARRSLRTWTRLTSAPRCAWARC